MTTKEKIEVMQHFDRGGDIEHLYLLDNDNKELWLFNINPQWDWMNFDYRIKLEHEEPKQLSHEQKMQNLVELLDWAITELKKSRG